MPGASPSSAPEAAADVEAELDQRFAARGAEVVKCRYEPELAKFRGQDGVEFAERMAHLGSETALQLPAGRASARRITHPAARTTAIVEGLPLRTAGGLPAPVRAARRADGRPAAATARPDDPGAVRQVGRLGANVARGERARGRAVGMPSGSGRSTGNRRAVFRPIGRLFSTST
ncbi:hypothetical protein [Amycolatopsis sp. FDAARGOS 1241]|uniref:hypothetical protein n=1 Tax=Amycolatopsis sp. FDAARGOS 1241 TaxID=2778070 RepID=UPI0019511660|nr:hypothetical protein [Amycolatopsis sp. FDAARGOS 1241]QRP45983.1 hypothetical protein I6J71_44165 [Amycolatopsis sp. FDAARGOS 1241]